MNGMRKGVVSNDFVTLRKINEANPESAPNQHFLSAGPRNKLDFCSMGESLSSYSIYLKSTKSCHLIIEDIWNTSLFAINLIPNKVFSVRC